MENYKIQIIESVIVIVAYFIINKILEKAIEKAGLKFEYQKPRIKLINKIVSIFLIFLSLGFILSIFGVEQSQLLYFLSTIITVVGIAFFAQWSILSNITSTVIIFFNHPTKIGDKIEILDKDYSIIGTISDIGVFFVIIKTTNDEKISIPSNLFTQKMIKKISEN